MAGRAGKADAGREAGRVWTWRQAIGIGCVAALHLAALYALLSTEYGPFAITLSLLAWLFANCLVLLFLPRPGIAAALSLMLTVVLIAVLALQVRHPAAFADLPRFPDHRPRHLFLPAVGIPAPEAAAAACRARRRSRAVADLAHRSVPRQPKNLAGAARLLPPCRSRRWHWQSPSSPGSRSRASTTSPTSRAQAWSRCRV